LFWKKKKNFECTWGPSTWLYGQVQNLGIGCFRLNTCYMIWIIWWYFSLIMKDHLFSFVNTRLFVVLSIFDKVVRNYELIFLNWMFEDGSWIIFIKVATCASHNSLISSFFFKSKWKKCWTKIGNKRVWIGSRVMNPLLWNMTSQITFIFVLKKVDSKGLWYVAYLWLDSCFWRWWQLVFLGF